MKDPDISIDFCGRHLPGPFILSSGPLAFDGEAMIRAYRAGFGACVTKTIRLEAAVNPPHHIAPFGRDSLINCEKWSDLSYQQWFDVEIPKAAEAGVPVIASIGHTPEEARALVKEAECAGSSMIELVSYSSDTMLPMLDYTLQHTSLPVICKVSGNWPDTVEIASKCAELGAKGICAIDSIGPVLSVRAETNHFTLGSRHGYGWLSGAAIKPVSMRYVSEISDEIGTTSEIYSSGGCMNVNDAVEFLKCGAKAVGICTAAILYGINYIAELNKGLKDVMKAFNLTDLSEIPKISGTGSEEAEGRLKFIYEPYGDGGKKKCISCRRCERVCPYGARNVEFPEMKLYPEQCRSCGLCADVCPTGALSTDMTICT